MAKQNSTKRKVTFSYSAPEAQAVMVAGEFTSWEKSPVALKKDKQGLWKATVALEPGSYEYRLLVDGQWRDDPNCGTRRANNFGGQNCVCVVDGA